MHEAHYNNEAHARSFADQEHNCSGRRTLGGKPKHGSKPSGHEAFLRALESSGATVEIEKASTGEHVVGKIKASDKYTISLRVPHTQGDYNGPYTTRVLFKHDISEFSPLVSHNDAPVSASAAVEAR